MQDEEFENIVNKSLEELPKEFASQLDNVEVVIEEWPLDSEGRPHARLLGLYHGVPKTARGTLPMLPDKITIYKGPLLMISHSTEEAKKNIKNTVLHELGHHFGLSDEELDRIKIR
jgi:predicted Zn-dependent protease with MMP-like domain